jgi:hypothetical protein
LRPRQVSNLLPKLRRLGTVRRRGRGDEHRNQTGPARFCRPLCSSELLVVVRPAGIEPARPPWQGGMLPKHLGRVVRVLGDDPSPLAWKASVPPGTPHALGADDGNRTRARALTKGVHRHGAASALWRCRELNPQDLLAGQSRVRRTSPSRVCKDSNLAPWFWRPRCALRSDPSRRWWVSIPLRRGLTSRRPCQRTPPAIRARGRT